MTSQLVVSSAEARENIKRFIRELRKAPDLAEIMSYTRAWYAERDANGWLYAPSKFIGYARNTARDYFRGRNEDRDGRVTERVLSQWFVEVLPGTPLYEDLRGGVQELFRDFGKVPNRRLRISVLASETDAERTAHAGNEQRSSRVTIKSDVCGGRPCIRSMRIRVSDILDLLAAGEDRVQILSEYPYLESEDIDAALAYAARSVDHRVIEAA